jgi:hypothetical protein
MALHSDDPWGCASNSPDVKVSAEVRAESSAREAAQRAARDARKRQIEAQYTGRYVVVLALVDDDGATYYRAVSAPEPDSAMKLALSWAKDGGRIFATAVTKQEYCYVCDEIDKTEALRFAAEATA